MNTFQDLFSKRVGIHSSYIFLQICISNNYSNDLLRYCKRHRLNNKNSQAEKNYMPSVLNPSPNPRDYLELIFVLN